MAETRTPTAFQFTGYYTTFMRMQSMGLKEWKQVVDCMREDGGNTLLLWMGGAFRSRKFPITWRYNQQHKNVQKDFVRALIDYAHAKQVKVLLCLTPYAFDGTNQYPLERPELKATQADGTPAKYWGMHSWGYNLCPAQPASQNFMLEYAREMLFEFYPNADGMMIESSDYAICYCPLCREKYYQNEFRFVKEISNDIWRVKPDATILVYPHYFTQRPVKGFGVSGAKQPFDPRWTLFFTPHSTEIDASLIKQAKSSIYWNEGMTIGTPALLRKGAETAQKYGMSGYIPSVEPMSCPSGSPEQPGERVSPFHFFWLKEGRMPLRELPIRVNRIAYRLYSQHADLSEMAFRNALGREIFGKSFSSQAVSDLLALQAAINFETDWLHPPPIMQPKRVSPEKREACLARASELRQIGERYKASRNRAEREMARIALTIANLWRE